MAVHRVLVLEMTSGLLVADAGVGGLRFDPDLLAGFITAVLQFAKEASGQSLHSIAFGNFRLLVQPGDAIVMILVVDEGDDEERYRRFLSETSAKLQPYLAREHRGVHGFTGVTQALRKRVETVLALELAEFSVRKAPSDLSKLEILQDASAQRLLRGLLEKNVDTLTPEPGMTRTGYSYPAAAAAAGLSDQESLSLVERMAEQGILTPEAVDFLYCCPQCGSGHLHPRILCPSCGAAAQPADLYEHRACGEVGVVSTKHGVAICRHCGAQSDAADDFRIMRGFHCGTGCGKSFIVPRIVFRCHGCTATVSPEQASAKMLFKYSINPAIRGEVVQLLFRGASVGGKKAPGRVRRASARMQSRTSNRPRID
jgi:hypothetical protein